MPTLLFVPNVGELQLMDNSVDFWNAVPGNCLCRLYSNNYTPVAGMTVASYTVATFKGYVDIDLDAWSAAAIVGGAAATTHPQVMFEYDSLMGGIPSEVIYGVVITDAGGNPIAAGLLSPGPVTMANNGDDIRVTPTLTTQEKSEA